MQDFEALRARVEEAAQRMKKAQTQRSERNQSLVGILSQLEEKFAAQEEELEFYKGRIRPLELANTQLSALIEKMLMQIEDGFGDDTLEPIRRASAMAAAMLSEAPESARGRGADAPGRFEDVGPERLAQDAAIAEDDLARLPESVRRAMVEQESAAFETAVARQPGSATGPATEEAVEIEMIAGADDGSGAPADIEMPEAPPTAGPKPARTRRTRRSAETVETVERLANALDQKSAAGEPLEAQDIKALLERVEALAHQDDGDESFDIDIPPARDEDDDIQFVDERTGSGKTGTEG